MSPDEVPLPIAGLLGLDVATVTGFAACSPGGVPIWGHRRMGAPDAPMGETLHFFGTWINMMLDRLRPRHVMIERPYIPQPARQQRVRFAGTTTQMPIAGIPELAISAAAPVNLATVWRLMAMTGRVYEACFERGIECQNVPTQVWSKFFVGRGSGFKTREAKKKAAMDTAMLYGWKATNDEADALGILIWAEHVFYPQIAAQRRPMPLFAGRAR